MRVFLLVLCLAPELCGATSIIQSKNTGTVNCGRPCSVTLANNVTPGSLLIVMAAASGGAATISSVAMAGEAFTVTNSCSTSTGAVLYSGCAYVLSATGGQKSLTVNYSASTIRTNVEVYEIGLGGGAAVFDAAGTIADGAFATSHNGVALSLTGTDVIVQAGGVATTPPYITAVGAPYNGTGTFTPVDSVYGVGYAVSLDTPSGTAPVWTTTSRPFAASAIAFKITGGVSVKRSHQVVSQ